MYDTITSFIIYPSSNRYALSGMPSLQCSCTFCHRTCARLLLHSFCCTFCGMATCTVSSATCNFFSSFQRGHSLHLCPFSPYLKHSTSTTSCFLIILSFTSHCITLLINTSNLFWGAVSLSSFPFLFLQLRARCPNPLQFQHSRSFFPSNFALNETRVCFCLSKLLINELYCCKDIVLHLCKGTEVMLVLANYHYVCWGTRSSPSQVPTALLTTALIIGLNYHLKERIPTLNGLLEVTVTPLYVSLTMECSTRLFTKKAVTNNTIQL